MQYGTQQVTPLICCEYAKINFIMCSNLSWLLSERESAVIQKKESSCTKTCKHQLNANIVCLAQMQQKIAKRFYVLIFQNVKPIWRRHFSDSLKNELHSLGFSQPPKTTFHSVLYRLFTSQMQKVSQRKRFCICKAHLTLKVTLKTLMKARGFFF